MIKYTDNRFITGYTWNLISSPTPLCYHYLYFLVFRNFLPSSSHISYIVVFIISINLEEKTNLKTERYQSFKKMAIETMETSIPQKSPTLFNSPFNEKCSKTKLKNQIEKFVNDVHLLAYKKLRNFETNIRNLFPVNSHLRNKFYLILSKKFNVKA